MLEFGALRSPIASAPEHLVGEWRVRAEDWELLGASDWEPVIGAAVVAVKKNGLRFSSGHALRVSGGGAWSGAERQRRLGRAGGGQ